MGMPRGFGLAFLLFAAPGWGRVQDAKGAATPQKFFEARREAVRKGDLAAYRLGLRVPPLKEIGLAENLRALAQLEPRAVRLALKELGIGEKDPAQVTDEELFEASLKKELSAIRDITIAEAKEDGDRATLEVKEERKDGSSKNRTLRLVREKGVWLDEWIGEGVGNARKAKCLRLLGDLTTAAKAHDLDFALYPPSGNANLVKALRDKGPKKMAYFEFAKEMLNEKGEVLDPWKQPLVYINNLDKKGPAGWKPFHRSSFDLYSFGPNGKDDKGGGDDLNNWE